jgi:hypothetical protein
MGQPLLQRMAPPARRLSSTALRHETWLPASTSLRAQSIRTQSLSDGARALSTRLQRPSRSCARRPARPAISPVTATTRLPTVTAARQGQAIEAGRKACSLPADRPLQPRLLRQLRGAPRSGEPLFKMSAGGSLWTGIRHALSHSYSHLHSQRINYNGQSKSSSVKSAFLGTPPSPHSAFIWIKLALME